MKKRIFMRKFIILAIASMILLSCGDYLEKRRLSSDLDSLCRLAFDLKLSQGMAVAVVQDGKVIFQKGYGYANTDSSQRVTPATLFYIASTTKSLTALTAAILHEKGLINLDESIADAYPAMMFKPPLDPADITLRDLLTLTHGIEEGGPLVFRTAYTGEYTRDILLELLKEVKPAEKGREFDYGNLGYILAGMIMEHKTGKDWKILVEEALLKPAGMNRTSAWRSRADSLDLAYPCEWGASGFRPLPYAKEDVTMHAAGGHVSSAEEMARFLVLQLNQGMIGKDQIIPAAAVLETHRPQAEQDRNFACFHRHAWGLGWDIGTYEADTLLHRFGTFPGFRSHVSFMPGKNVGVVVLVNEGLMGSMQADLAAVLLYERLIDPENFAVKADSLIQLTTRKTRMLSGMITQNRRQRGMRKQILPIPLIRYTGIFVNEELGTMTWRLKDDKLEMQMGILTCTPEIYDGRRNQLRVELKGRGQVVAFQFQDGRVQSLTYDGKFFYPKN